MSSSVSLTLNPYTLSLHNKPLSPFPISSHSLPFAAATSSLTRASLSPLNPPDPDPEERRWLREERRWLREEQRWLREERRWISERDVLLREISELKLKIQALERRSSVRGASVSETLAQITVLLQMLKEADAAKASRTAETGLGANPMVLEAVESDEVENVRVEEVVGVSGGGGIEEKMAKKTTTTKKKKKKVALRTGSEGEDVRAMQVCSQYAFVLPE